MCACLCVSETVITVEACCITCGEVIQVSARGKAAVDISSARFTLIVTCRVCVVSRHWSVEKKKNNCISGTINPYFFHSYLRATCLAGGMMIDRSNDCDYQANLKIPIS